MKHSSLLRRTLITGRPESDGTVVVTGLNFPIDIEFDRAGRLLILDSAELDPFKVNGRILRFDLPH